MSGTERNSSTGRLLTRDFRSSSFRGTTRLALVPVCLGLALGPCSLAQGCRCDHPQQVEPAASTGPVAGPPATRCARARAASRPAPASDAWSNPVDVRSWLEAQEIWPGDVQARMIPRGWITGQRQPTDPECEAVTVGHPPTPGLLCSEVYTAQRDPHWPNDREWSIWKASEHKLVRVWRGRKTLDGLALSLEFTSPDAFVVGRVQRAQCKALDRRLRSKYTRPNVPAGHDGVPPIVDGAIRDFCQQLGQHEWDGERFVKAVASRR